MVIDPQNKLTEDFAFGFAALVVAFFLAGAVAPTTFLAAVFFFGEALV
jgi:hypothetical protein